MGGGVMGAEMGGSSGTVSICVFGGNGGPPPNRLPP